MFTSANQKQETTFSTDVPHGDYQRRLYESAGFDFTRDRPLRGDYGHENQLPDWRTRRCNQIAERSFVERKSRLEGRSVSSIYIAAKTDLRQPITIPCGM